MMFILLRDSRRDYAAEDSHLDVMILLCYVNRFVFILQSLTLLVVKQI